jgi:chromosome segregation ATPase
MVLIFGPDLAHNFAVQQFLIGRAFMIPVSFTKLGFLAIAATGSLAFGQTKVAEKKGWSVWETNTNGIETCTLQSVNKILFRAEDFYFELSKLKNKASSPVEVMMRIQKNKKESTALVIQIPSTNSQIGFADLSGTRESYWGVAKNLSALIKTFSDNQAEILMIAKGGKKEIEFSMSGVGFKEMLTELENRCNGGQSIVRSSFESEFFANVSPQVEPTHLNPTQTTQLRANYLAAYAIHTQIQETKAQLNQVLAKYQGMIDELNVNRAEFNQITTKDLVASQKTLAEAQKLQIDMKAEIVRLDQLIPSLSAKVNASELAYNKSKATLAPLEPEFNRLTSALSDAQSILSNALSRLSQIDSRTQDLDRAISAMDNEARNLEQSLPWKRQELDRTSINFRNAESARMQYNVSWERDRTLRSHPEYSQLISQRDMMAPRISQAQSEARQLEFERSRIAQAVEQCHAGGGLIPGQTGLTPPSPIATEPPPELPTQDTPPSPLVEDCTAKEQALSVADQMLAQKRTEVDQLVGRQQEVLNRISMIENQVNNEINHIYRQLVDNEDRARRELGRAQDDFNMTQNRLSQLRGSDIPRAVSERNQLSNERPSVVSRIQNGQADVARLTNDLNKFKSANQWDTKVADLRQKESVLSSDRSNLADANRDKSTAQSRLASGIDTEAKMKTRIAELTARVDVLNKRAAELNLGLKNLPAERAPFDAKINSLQTDLDVKKQNFLANL